MKSRNNLKNKVWLYLSIFSVFILLILGIFSSVFYNLFYEWKTVKKMDSIAGEIINNYGSDNFNDVLDKLTYSNGVCIEVIVGDFRRYSTNSFSKGCSDENINLYNFKKDFIESGKIKKSAIVKNSKFNNKTIVYGIKLDSNTSIFVNASLSPTNRSTNIYSSQFIYISLIVLIIALIIAVLISNKISKPILKINESVQKMGKGNYNVDFTTDSSIYEIKELSNTLNQTKNELAKTDELRRELLANVSHDLKTPLTMLKAYAEMIRDINYKDKKKMKDNLNIIIDETDRLNLLVNDILDLSKMQSNIIELNYEYFDLDLVIKNIISRFDYLKETNSIYFKCDIDSNLSVYADKKKIEQVIYNLISNAINYVGEDKQIVINAKLVNDMVKVSIEDHGEGLDREELNLIWDKYYKIDKQYKRNKVGTGLGLSIVKNIFELHNIDYGVNSKKKEGTSFYFNMKFKNK